MQYATIDEMKIILAQGNPGTQYTYTRHNVGFITLDTIATELEGKWHSETKFRADIAEVHINHEKVLLVKPKSFYNETGTVGRALIDFYKLDPSEDVLVIHDELALPFGTVRIRDKGSDAGNNGIKSLNSHIGSDYFRIRIGIWNELRDRIDDANFVLSSFTQKEQEELKATIIPSVATLVEQFVKGTLEVSSQKHL